MGNPADRPDLAGGLFLTARLGFFADSPSAESLKVHGQNEEGGSGEVSKFRRVMHRDVCNNRYRKYRRRLQRRL